MNVRTYAIATSIVFFIVAAVHFLRVVLGWSLMIGTWQFPMWLSVAAVVVAGFLSFAGLKLAQAQSFSLFRK